MDRVFDELRAANIEFTGPDDARMKWLEKRVVDLAYALDDMRACVKQIRGRIQAPIEGFADDE